MTAVNGIGYMDRWIPEAWNSYVLMTAKKNSFWMSMFGGVGSGSAVINYTDIKGKPGDTLHLPTDAFFTGDPITTDTGTVEGQGEQAAPDLTNVTLEIARYMHEWTDIAAEESLVDLFRTASNKISYQMADYIDERMFAVACATHTYNIYGGTSLSADSDLASTDVFNVTAVRKMRAKLEVNRAHPIGNIGGTGIFGVAIHPRDRYGLITDTTYNNMVQYADVRGADGNPLFTGQIPIIDGVAIFVTHNVPCDNSNSASPYTEGGVGSGTAEVSHPFAFGAEAMAYVGKIDPKLEAYQYDANTKKGVLCTSVFGLSRLTATNSVLGHYYATDV